MNKLYWKFAILLAVTAFVAAKEPATFWVQRKLDNFNSSDTRTMFMRFSANDEFFQTGGPIFIHVGGREPFSPANIDKGTQIYRLAKEHNGYLLHTQHRFYGLTLELITDEKLKYLNTEQAMADLAQLIRIMRKTHGSQTKIILVGCSSGGALATWFKKLYPELANGVWASSAMLLAKADLSESAVLVGETIKQVGGVECYNRIKGSIAEMEVMFENYRGADIKAIFNISNSFKEYNDLDVSTLFFQISETFFQLVANHKVDEIQKTCTKLLQGKNALVALGRYIAGKLGDDDCKELSYNANLNCLRNPAVLGRESLRQLTYQGCNEFGWFKSRISLSQIFGTKLSLDYFFNMCRDLYGDKFTKEYVENKVKETNNKFGGLNPDIENVYWTNGALDPYRLLSMQSGPHTTVIPNLCRCGDMHEVTPEDSPELKASQEKLEGLVREWLA